MGAIVKQSAKSVVPLLNAIGTISHEFFTSVFHPTKRVSSKMRRRLRSRAIRLYVIGGNSSLFGFGLVDINVLSYHL